MAQSGRNPGGGGRGRSAFGGNVSAGSMLGDSVIENSMRDNNGVGDSGGGNASMLVDATGGEGASGGVGAQTLREWMATIMRDAGRGDGAAAGSGNVIRDDVTVRSNRFVQRFRQLCQEKPDDVPRR